MVNKFNSFLSIKMNFSKILQYIDDDFISDNDLIREIVKLYTYEPYNPLVIQLVSLTKEYQETMTNKPLCKFLREYF